MKYQEVKCAGFEGKIVHKYIVVLKELGFIIDKGNGIFGLDHTKQYEVGL